MERRAWLRLLALLTAIGLLAAACGSDDDVADDGADVAAGESSDESADSASSADDETETTTETLPPPAENPYEGETVEILIPFSEGGGTDTWGRALAPFLEKYLADDVSVVVFNDGGKTAAVSSYERATEHDGLTVFVSSGSISIPYLLDQEGVEYDYADFVGIIGSPVGGVVYASTDPGIASSGPCGW